MFVETFFPCFLHIYFLTQTAHFAWAIAFALWPFLAIFKMLSFFQYYLFFRAVFCIEQLECACRNVFRMFFAYLIFNPNCPFCMGYSLCIVAIFGHFQNALIFPILPVFSTHLCLEQLECVCRNVFRMFFAYLFFNPNCPF